MEPEASLFEQTLSRNRFLRLVGMGAGLSLLPSSLAVLGAGSALGATADILAYRRYPIGLWWPPPPERTTAYRYQQIREAGFNFVIGGNGVSNDAENTQALEAASANGLRFLLRIADSTGPSTTASMEPSGHPHRRPRRLALCATYSNKPNLSRPLAPTPSLANRTLLTPPLVRRRMR